MIDAGAGAAAFAAPVTQSKPMAPPGNPSGGPPPIAAQVLKSLKQKPAAGGAAAAGAGGKTGLVPQQFEQFQDRTFWDNFFKERRNEAFEWYGTYAELRPHVARAVPRKDASVLVVGCGNSDFSTQLYLEGGYHKVVNVDFSAPVIEEMRAKTAALCPNMQWLVQDVTALDMADQAVDVVLDKGTLDAIFSTPESEPQADKMLDEVCRVAARNHGRYLAVTLGQDFILRKLLQRFGSGGSDNNGWRLDLHAVEQAESPFLTLVAVASRPQAPRSAADKQGEEGDGDGSSQKPIALHFDAGVRRLTATEGPLRFGPGDHGEVMALVAQAQERHAVKQELRRVQPGRFKGDIDIWLQSGDDEGEGGGGKGPRYTLSVVDLEPPTRTPLPCAVLLIPQGREHEWLFATADGLRQVGQSADYRRLICVRMNRGHRFRDMEEVKAELGGVVMDFVPADRDPGYLVPYLAVGDSIGSRNVVASGELPLCGEYCVEEEDDEEDGGPGAVLRRLVFLRNQHVIQSEIRLVPPRKAGGGGGKSKGKGGGKKGKGGGKKKKGGSSNKTSAADDDGEEAEGEEALAVDWSYLCFDYHRAIVAGLIGLLYPRLRAAFRGEASSSSSSPLPPPRCLVIGLGGGGLPLFLRRYVPCLDVTVVELEGGLAGVAEGWFGFRPDEKLRVEVGDGLARVMQGHGHGGGGGGEEGEEEAPWDAIVVDVDNNDASLGISCPAPAFLAADFLEACRRRLAPEGVLITNVAARSSELLGGALDALAQAFASPAAGGEIYEVRPTEQDVNRVVFALKAPRPAAAAAKASLGLLTERWLEETAGGGGGKGKGGGPLQEVEDPLELSEMSRRIQKRACK